MANQKSNVEARPIIPWWLVLIEGIAAIILGILLLTRPASTTIVLIQFLGIYWLITGVFSLVSLFWDRTAWGWKLFNGILGIVVGVLIIQNPLWSTLLVPVTLAFVIGFMGIFIGVIQLFQAFKGGGWGIGILGALSIMLGFLLITRPVIAGLALPWVLGITLIFGGILALFAAFGLMASQRRTKQARMEAAAQAPVSASRVETIAVIGSAESASAPAVAAAESTHPVAAAEITPAVAAAGAAGIAAASIEVVKSDDEAVIAPGAAAADEVIQAAEVAESDLEAPVVEDIVAASLVAVQASDLASEPTDIDPTLGADRAADFEIEELAESETVVDSVFDIDALADMVIFKNALEYVEGIGPAYAEKLRAIDLVTCLDFLKSGATRKGREEIVEKTGITGKLILKWVNHLDLYRIKGVGSEYADLLEAAGVDTVVELAQRNPGNLFGKMSEVNAEKALVRKLPTAIQIEGWVTQAKELPRVVTY